MRSTLIRVFLPISLGFAITSQPAVGQTLSFLRQLRANETPEVATGIIRDATGVYVASTYPVSSRVAGGAAYDTNGLLRKFDASGAELWTRQLGGQVFPGGLATDGLNLYVAARRTFGPDIFVRRYDTDGNELWTRQFSNDISTV